MGPAKSESLFTPRGTPNNKQLWAELDYIRVRIVGQRQVLPEQGQETCLHPGEPQTENNSWDNHVQKQFYETCLK